MKLLTRYNFTCSLFSHWQPQEGALGLCTCTCYFESDAEEEVALRLPAELAELFRSDTEDEEFSRFSDLE